MANDTTVTIPNARLAADPVTSYAKNSGKPYMRLRFASTPYRYDKQTRQNVDGETEWWSVTEFDTRRMETYLAELHQGDSVEITGVLELSTYQDRQGQTVIDRRVRFATIRKNLPRAKQQQQQQAEGYAPQQPTQAYPPADWSNDDFNGSGDNQW